MLTEQQKAFLRLAAVASVACERSTRLPAELTLAQAVLESDWGHDSPGNNCFGIKASKRHARTQKFISTEVISGKDVTKGDKVVKRIPGGRVEVERVEEFAAFDSIQACFEDHALLITTKQKYAKAWWSFLTTGDLIRFINEVSPIYGTGMKYADSIHRILRMKEIKAALDAARKTVG